MSETEAIFTTTYNNIGLSGISCYVISSLGSKISPMCDIHVGGFLFRPLRCIYAGWLGTHPSAARQEGGGVEQVPRPHCSCPHILLWATYKTRTYNTFLPENIYHRFIIQIICTHGIK